MPAPRTKRSPAHAAGLPAWEQLAIVLVFSLAVASVVAFSVQRPSGQHIANRNATPAGHATPSGGGTAATSGSPTRIGPAPAAGPQPKPPPGPAPASPAGSSGQGSPGSAPSNQKQVARTRSGSLFSEHLP